MFQLKTAMELTTSHGLPRVVTNKPLFVRLLWLLMFLFMLALFLKGLYEFAVKLQSRQVTNTLEANSVNFQFPDVYVCFENPISGSYSANLDAKSADAMNAQFNASKKVMHKEMASLGYTAMRAVQTEIAMSFLYVGSTNYNLLIDLLAHRKEQDVITSDVTYNTDYGMPVNQQIDPATFYHPMFLSCLKWSLNSTWQSKILQTGSTSGIVLNLNTDNNFTGMPTSGIEIQQKVYAKGIQIPVSDWTLSVSESYGPERRSGIRVFLTPPGEYPSDFVTSFSLGPGKHHTVEIYMSQQVYTDGQFDCVSDPADVQFLNPYDQTPYSHAYSYSYCFYYEYHKLMQNLVNMSGIIGPLPWPLRNYKFVVNLTGDPNVFIFHHFPALVNKSNQIYSLVKSACERKQSCSKLYYSVGISSAEWPTQSSVVPFVRSSIKEAWTSAKVKNLSVPALDFLMTTNASTVESYIRSNILKVHFRPHRVLCDRVTFSIEYGMQNFISDVGGIMGIYLGMSLLTMCELLELFYDLAAYRVDKKKTKITQVKVCPEEVNEKN